MSVLDGSTRFKKVFVIRYSAYLAMLIGFFATVFQFGPLVMAEGSYRLNQIAGVRYQILPNIITSNGVIRENTPDSSNAPRASLGQVGKSTGPVINPVSTEYGIVIEKINANAKVIANVDVSNESAYVKALSQGVAAASISTEPGKPGNLFIFSHSTDASWNIARYNAIFFLLRELVAGDRILIFYQGRRYDYVVYDRHIVKPTDVSYLVNRYDQPVLTLQTCDPPGTLSNRLIVRAKLAGY